MKNAKLGKVEVRSSRLPPSRNNLSRDIHTTMTFCDFQPTMVHEMEPDSSFTMNNETGVLMGSMVCPTMGRLNLESFGLFVPTEDIFPCYKEFKTGTPFTYGAETFVPFHRPRVPIAVLSMFCLFGARATIYECVYGQQSPKFQQWKCYDTAQTSHLIEQVKQSYNNYALFDHRTFGGFDGTSLRCISAAYILKSFNLDVISAWHTWFSNEFAIPVAGDPASGFTPGFLYGKSNDIAESIRTTGTRFVSIAKPDFQINIPFKSDPNSQNYDKLACICFKMSDFGRRIYKVLRGCGWTPNFNDPLYVDVSPLFATWKAYYDMFGIKKWSNYQNTALARLLALWMNAQCPGTVLQSSAMCNAFTDFMVDVGRMWFTDEQDYVTAHQPNVEDDPTNPISSSGFIDVGSSLGSIGSASDVLYGLGVKPTPDGFSNEHFAINRVLHSQVDSELLKKFYLWTNRNSVIGMRVAELLKAQGFEKWINEHEARFIGHHTIQMHLDKVVAQADTYNSTTDEGALLGEYGGRGLGYDENSIFSYKTREHGFFIVLSAIVPKAGFCQGEDLRWRRDSRMDEYQPEFDGVGMNASPKSLIYAGDIRTPVSTADGTHFQWHDKTFGFIPMYSRYKYMQNLMNGEFQFGSTQLDKLCYTLDRILIPNNADVELKEHDEVYDLYHLKYGDLDALSVPIAGVLWRYLGRYGWLANFRRIFAVRGNSDEDSVGDYMFYNSPALLELSVSGPDDFIVHQVQNNKYWAHMLSLEGSFETKQDGNSGSHDMVVSKA